MSRKSVPIDAVTLTDYLRSSNQLENVGGVAFVQSLVDDTPTSAHAEYYIDTVRQKYLLSDRVPDTILNGMKSAQRRKPAQVFVRPACIGFVRYSQKAVCRPFVIQLE